MQPAAPGARPTAACRRLLARLAVVLAGAAVAVLTLSAPAAAHPALVSSDPLAGYALQQAPEQVLLRFSEPVQPAARPLELVRDDGTSVPLLVGQEDGGAVLRGTVDGDMPAGQYVTRYDVVAQDGDVVRGEIAFSLSVAPSTGGAGVAPPTAPGVNRGAVLPRAALFAGLALALGGLVGAWDARRVAGGAAGVVPLVRTTAVLAAAGAGTQLVLLADGSAGRIADLVAVPGAPRLLLAETLLLVLAAVLPRRAGLGRLGALLAVVLLEGLRAHPGKVAGTAGVVLTVVHLLAAALWVGGLVHVLRVVVRRRGTPVVPAVVASYTRNALALVLVVAVTGTASGLLLLPSASDLVDTTYGRVLLTKLAVVAAVVAAAAVARARLRQRADLHLGRSARLEAGLLVAVLLVTGALTSSTPARLVPAGAVLAAPTGPVLRVAERAQQASVSAVVSEGRLDLRADVPDDGRPVAYRLDVRVTAADGTVVRPAVRGCGTACWTAEVTWPTGASEVAVDLSAEPWQAGRVVLPVVWPPTPAPELLERVRAAMAAQPAVETVETVTSGFGVDVPSTSLRTGQEYLDAQSWPAGGATDVTVVPGGGRRTLLFALPALGYHFRLELDAQERVVAERIVTPNHLLTREYRYP